MKQLASLAVAAVMVFASFTAAIAPASAADPNKALYELELALEKLFGGPDRCKVIGVLTFRAYQRIINNADLPDDMREMLRQSCRKHIFFPSLSELGPGNAVCPPFPDEFKDVENLIYIQGNGNTVVHTQHGSTAFTWADGNGNVVTVMQHADGGHISVIVVVGNNNHISIDQSGSPNQFAGVFVGDDIDYNGSQSGGESCLLEVNETGQPVSLTST